MQFDDYSELKEQNKILEKELEKYRRLVTLEELKEYKEICLKHKYELKFCELINNSYNFTCFDLLTNNGSDHYSFVYSKTGRKPTAKELIIAITCLDREIEMDEWAKTA